MDNFSKADEIAKLKKLLDEQIITQAEFEAQKNALLDRIPISSNLNQSPNNTATISDKSRIAAGIMGIFLGGLGIHNFYLGYKTKAILQLCLTIGLLFSILFAFLAVFPIIWGFVEGCMLLAGAIKTDADGLTLRS
jgi:TM2 domain-containing membrane protein YozV